MIVVILFKLLVNCFTSNANPSTKSPPQRYLWTLVDVRRVRINLDQEASSQGFLDILSMYNVIATCNIMCSNVNRQMLLRVSCEYSIPVIDDTFLVEGKGQNVPSKQ